jgi:replicative DNA helicase
MIFNEVIHKAEQGMLGANDGLPMGLPKLEYLVNKVQKGTYYLVAGKTSSGKTAFVDQCFLSAPFEYYLANKEKIKVNWLYFSLEIAPVNKITKLAAREIDDRYGFKTSMAELLSYGDHKMTPELKEALESTRDYFEELESCVEIYDAYDTPSAIRQACVDFFMKHGTIEERDGREIYTPNHPNHYTFIVVDTINLVTPERGQTQKQAIDAVSKDMIYLRNVCNAIPVVCQQYNANISDPNRKRMEMQEPIVDDLEDSKRTSKDCNTYFSVFDPSEMGQTTSPGGYNLTGIGNKFRQIKVHKNRDGERDKRIGCHFQGRTGSFFELPAPLDMKGEDYERIMRSE